MADDTPHEVNMVKIDSGKSFMVYHAGRVIKKQKYDKDILLTTSLDVFVGTEEEIDAKIAELGLKVNKQRNFGKTLPPRFKYTPTMTQETIQQPIQQPQEPVATVSFVNQDTSTQPNTDKNPNA